MAAIPGWAKYRPAENPARSCLTCDWFSASRCVHFDNAPVKKDYTCDVWEGEEEDVFSAAPNNRGKTIEQNLLEDPSPVLKAEVKAAGIAVRAKDTGRVLMIQRSNDANDPAAGTWEFPGGKLEDGEDPKVAAKREWQEEVGANLPKGEHVGSWRHGVYQGFIHEVASEDSVPTNQDHEDRHVLNPDDPDGDSIEVAAWWDPKHLKGMAALRQELRGSRPWARLHKGFDPIIVGKAHKNPDVVLMVHGLSRTADMHVVYRLSTADGKYVGRTIPSKIVAKKGDSLKVRMGKDVEAVDVTPDAPHSWEELQALAGGKLYSPDVGMPASTQDYSADGPGGRIPYPGDTMNLSDAALGKEDGSGPTSSSVHIDAPLPNISVSYATVGKKLKRVKPKPVDEEPTVEPMLVVHKADPMKQIVYGVVLEPHVLDSQSDFMLPQHVEKAAHTYLKKIVRGKASVSKFQHRKPALFKNKPSVVPVESFIAPQDFTYDGSTDVVKKGSWVLAVHVEDPDTWQDVIDGKWAGFSVGGVGVRQSMTAETLLEGHQWMGDPQPYQWSPQPTYTG